METTGINEIIRNFSNSILNKNAILFCGAGISVDSGLPSWESLLLPFMNELKISSQNIDLPLVAQFYISNIENGRSKLERGIFEQLSIETYKPNKFHHLINKLPIYEIWTTNYDNLIESEITKIKVYRKDIEILSEARIDERVLIKMHGDLTSYNTKNISDCSTNNKSIVISREDYERYEHDYPRMWTRLKAAFITKSIFFIGFSFDDPNINLLLRLARIQFTCNQKQHYAIIKEPDSPQDKILHKLKVNDLSKVGIRCMSISNYNEIGNILRKLIRTVTPPTVFISGSYNGTTYDKLCKDIGILLASLSINTISGANTPGLKVGYASADKLLKMGKYKPEKVTHYFQATEKPPIPLERRIGSIKFYGSDRKKMRKEILSQVRAVIVLGGSVGTSEEIKLAKSMNISIIPIGMSEGTARKEWLKMEKNLDLYFYGGNPTDPLQFRKLNSSNEKEVIDGLKSILKTVMYIK